MSKSYIYDQGSKGVKVGLDSAVYLVKLSNAGASSLGTSVASGSCIANGFDMGLDRSHKAVDPIQRLYWFVWDHVGSYQAAYGADG